MRTKELDAHWFPFWYCVTCSQYTADSVLHGAHSLEKLEICPRCNLSVKRGSDPEPASVAGPRYAYPGPQFHLPELSEVDAEICLLCGCPVKAHA